MKKILLLPLFVAAAFLTNAQNIGIGTNTPRARLHVIDSSVVFSASGDVLGTPGNPPIYGQGGRRMMWYSDKAAFRAGYVLNTNWDKDSIGEYSVALGNNNKALGNSSFATGNTNIASGITSTALGNQSKALGNYSTAMGYTTIASGLVSSTMGYNTIASGSYSTALGNNSKASGFGSISMGRSTASGTYSTAMGGSSTASGDYSIAVGFISSASGNYSTAIGSDAFANSVYSVAIGEDITSNSQNTISLGRHNDPILASPTPGWELTDPILIVGNGTSSTDRKNALVILKNGNVGIGSNTPGFPLSFASVPGNKISLFGNPGAYYGLGMQSGLMQIFTDGQNSDIGFGYGSSSSFTENMRLKGNGDLLLGISNTNATLTFGQSLSKKIVFFRGSTGEVGMSVFPGELRIYSDFFGGAVTFGYDNISVGFIENMRIDEGDLHVRRNIFANSTFYTSDSRYKKNLQPLHSALKKITELQGYTYYWKDEELDPILQSGVIAQEVQAIFPELVRTDNKGYLSVNYVGLIPYLIESIKELKKENEELKKIKDEVEDLKKMIISKQ